jgi:5-formyltetrahydrofolate cyclo-ligase
VPIAYRRQASITAANLFIKQPLFTQNMHIACYLACQHEFDSQPLIKAIWQAKKHCYLPVLTPKKSLQFVHYAKGDALRTNPYSILEPANISQSISPQQLDIVFTPLLAFDSLGHRLGVGGGYYDRALAFRGRQSWLKPIIIGLAYAQQEARHLPFDTWDVSLDAVLTEQGYRILCKLPTSHNQAE